MIAQVAELLTQAKELAEKLRWSEAADLLSGAGEDSYVLDRRGWYLSRAKRYAEALAIFEELARREPDNFRHFYMAGSQHYEQGNYADALPWMEETLRRDPAHLKAWWRKAYSLHAAKDEPGACQAAAQVLSIWHASGKEEQERGRSVVAKASHLLARAQLQRFPSDAVDLARQATENDPDDPYHHHLLGKALLRIGDAEKALVSLRSAERLKRGDPNIEVSLADALVRTGDSQGAISAITRVERALRGWQALKGGRLALAAGDPRLALRLLTAAQRDRQVREDGQLNGLLEQARGALPADGAGEDPTADVELPPRTGRVDMVNADRGFGFLVDDDDQQRRYFQTKGSGPLSRGDRVRFIPFEAEKGPAARAVRPE